MIKSTPFAKLESIVKNKVYGCLADATMDFDRYEKYLGYKHKIYSLKEFWSDRELDLFINKIKVCFNQDIVLMKKDTINDVAKKIMLVVRKNLENNGGG